jgi:hypothetical protein
MEAKAVDQGIRSGSFSWSRNRFRQVIAGRPLTLLPRQPRPLPLTRRRRRLALLPCHQLVGLDARQVEL